MKAPNDIVILFDCHNTLLDNDRVEADLRNHLEREFGSHNRDRYWEIFEALRGELGYADYLGALQRYRLGDMNDPCLLQMSSFLWTIRLPNESIRARSTYSRSLARGDQQSFCRMAM